MLTIFVQTFFMVFFAEMGDKTQLLVMTLALKYKSGAIMGGIALAQTALGLTAVLLGKCIAAYVPLDFIRICAGVLFLMFALFSLFSEKEEEPSGRSFSLPAFLAVALAFFAAELGDRTQITTLTGAATANGAMALAMVFFGASLAMLAANGTAVWFTKHAGRHIPEKAFQTVSAILFSVFGFWSLLHALTGYLDAGRIAALLGAVAALFLAAAFNIIHRKKRRKGWT